MTLFSERHSKKIFSFVPPTYAIISNICNYLQSSEFILASMMIRFIKSVSILVRQQ